MPCFQEGWRLKRPARSQVLTALLVFVLAVSAFLFAYVLPAGASGGGHVNAIGANNNSGSSSCAPTLTNFQSGDYILMFTWLVGGDKIKGVNDGGSDTFTSQGYVNSTNFRVALWSGQYRGATGSVTVIMSFTSSGVNKCVAAEVTGLNSAAADDVSSAVGSAASSSATLVLGSAMTTPNTDICYEGAGVLDTGTVSASTFAPAAPFGGNPSAGSAGTVANGKILQADQRTSWPSNTATFTFSTATTQTGATNIEWALLTACFPTTQMTTTATVTTTPTTAYSTTVTSTSYSPTVTSSTTLTSYSPTVTSTYTSYSPTVTSTETDTNTITTTATTTPTVTVTTASTSTIALTTINHTYKILFSVQATCDSASTCVLTFPGAFSGDVLILYVVGYSTAGNPGSLPPTSNRTGDSFVLEKSSLDPTGQHMTSLYMSNTTSDNTAQLTENWLVSQDTAQLICYVATDPPSWGQPFLQQALGLWPSPPAPSGGEPQSLLWLLLLPFILLGIVLGLKGKRLKL